MRGAAFGFELVVGLSQAPGEWGVGVAVLGLAHDVVLAAGKVGESALEPVSFGLSLLVSRSSTVARSAARRSMR